MGKNDIIKMDYPLARAMATSMGKGAKQLEAGIGEMNKAMALLKNGGLRGEAGEAFADSMRGSLIPAMQRLQEKYAEMQRDIITNIQLKQLADKSSKSALQD
jgi:WXG100 family type VII secretion target